jgi:hypothetical protein
MFQEDFSHRSDVFFFFERKNCFGADLALADSGEIHVTVKRGEPYDKWRVPALGTSTADLWLKAAEPFDPNIYPGTYVL